MSFRSCYADLNVLVQGSKKINGEMLRFLCDYGYELVAFNHELELTKKVQVKVAPDIKTVIDSTPSAKAHRPFQLLQRLTVSVSDPSILHTLSSPSLDSYDLLAIQPGTDKVFQQACSVLSVDIISLKLDERLPFRIKHAQIGQAIERGIYFEICYSPAIRDATARRYILANAMELVVVTKGKNIIVASQAEKAMDIRGPADVVNLCHLFGMNGGICKSTITSHCRSALLHSTLRRKTAKGVVSCEQLKEDQLEVEEGVKESVASTSTETKLVSGSKRRRSSEITSSKRTKRKKS